MGGLQAETTYYYRLAAQGPQGVIRGEVKNFKTLPAPAPAPTPPANGTSTPPANATSTPPAGGTPPPASGGESFPSLIARVENGEPEPGEEFNYILTHRNTLNYTLKSAQINVALPAELEYVIATSLPTIENGRLLFNLGEVAPGAESANTIRLRVKSSAVSGNVPLNSALIYADSNNRQRTIAANLSLFIPAAETSGGASTDRTLAGLPWYSWLFILLGILIVFVFAYVLYRYGRTRRALRASQA